MKTVRGYDYRLGREVHYTPAEWRQHIAELGATGMGRTVRHRGARPGDNDLLLIHHGRIVAEVYDRESESCQA
jgi:hypothetical protein